jgi:hypothetical protein
MNLDLILVILAYLGVFTLAFSAANQFRKDDPTQKKDFVIFITFIGVLSLFFPGYWVLFMLLNTLVAGAYWVLRGKGSWRIILCVPAWAAFAIFGGLVLPVFWW